MLNITLETIVSLENLILTSSQPTIPLHYTLNVEGRTLYQQKDNINWKLNDPSISKTMSIETLKKPRVNAKLGGLRQKQI